MLCWLAIRATPWSSFETCRLRLQAVLCGLSISVYCSRFQTAQNKWFEFYLLLMGRLGRMRILRNQRDFEAKI